MIDEILSLKIKEGIMCCQFGSNEGMDCIKCPYHGIGCKANLKMDVLRFIEFFSTADGFIDALGLKTFVE